MTHTPTPAEIETLRNYAHQHRGYCIQQNVAGSRCDCGALQVHAILDRLSPAPEPDVDEATVWTRKIWGTEGDGACDRDTVFQEARTVIAELLASKDAEIERRIEELFDWEKIAKRTKEALTGAEDELRVCYSELATLRAENERCVGLLRWAHDTLYEINPSMLFGLTH